MRLLMRTVNRNCLLSRRLSGKLTPWVETRMPKEDLLTFRWVGGTNAYLDEPNLDYCGDIVIGAYGGSIQAGAVRNEDAVLILNSPRDGWKFAALLDAHYSTESDDLIFATLEQRQTAIIEALSKPVGSAFDELRSVLIEAFSSDSFRKACQGVVGEASCIFVAQKARFVFWLTIGDCLGFALHSELAGLGQFAMNQRHFFEWVGKSNVFDLDVPALSTGVQELRQGRNSVVLVTDGLYEYPHSPFVDPAAIYATLGPGHRGPDISTGVMQALETVHEGGGRDSATVVAWQSEIREQPTRSSQMPR